jgi:hypothetical protein
MKRLQQPPARRFEWFAFVPSRVAAARPDWREVRMKKLLLLALFLMALTLTQSNVLACQCFPTQDPAIEYEQVDAVFMGFVISISPSSSPDYLDVLIGVTGYWKGTIVPIMHVYTGEFAGSCGFEFQLYESYLIYALDSDEECCTGVFTWICNRTQYLSGAGADLEYLGDPMNVPVEQMSWGAIKEIYRE